MNCIVFKSINKSETFIFIKEGLSYDSIPKSLRGLLGETEEVLTFDISTKSKLASADIEQVKQCLNDNGYYLQLPRKDYTVDQAILNFQDNSI